MKFKALALAMILGAFSLAVGAIAEAQEFNREACYASCFSQTGGGRGGRNASPALAECRASCERAFWRTYDRRMRNIEEKADRKFYD
jgi:hypothetical protein